MKRIFGYILITFIWLEAVYHIAIFGLNGVQPLLILMFAVLIAGIETICAGISKKRGVNLGILWGVQGFNLLLFAVQLVYHEIFTQPLLLETAFITGTDAITDFWGVALDGIGRSLIPLLLMSAPLIVMAVLLKKKLLVLKQYDKKEYIAGGCSIAAVIVATVTIFVGGNFMIRQNIQQ